MKKIIIIILIIIGWGTKSNSQNIVMGEYFFDEVGTYGTGTPLDVSNPNNDITISSQLSVSNLPEGLHRLFVRFKDSNGHWSQTQNFPVFVKHPEVINIVRGEYFFDAVGEYGTGDSLNLAGVSTMTDVLQNLSVTNLSEGLHRLFVRFQSSDGRWSQTQNFPVFIKHPEVINIVSGEYFFDDKVEYDGGFQIDMDSIAAITTASDMVTAPINLPMGPHTMYYRFKDSNGLWSHTYSEIVCINVVQGKYQTNANSYVVGDTVFFSHTSNNNINAIYNWDLNDDGNFNDLQTTGEDFFYEIINATTDSITFKYRITSALCSGWEKINSITVAISQSINVAGTATDILCNGDSAGSINLTISGGIPDYIFLWSTGDMTEDLNDLGAGTFTVTVTDAVGIESIHSYIINEPPPISVVANTTGTCINACDGSVTLVTSGGTAPYTITFDNVPDPMNICAGVYNITIMDNNGCIKTQTFTIVEFPEITLQVDNIINTTDGQSNGAIEITSSGGTPPFTYEWTLNNLPVSNMEDPTGLTAGEYMLEVTDANDCIMITTAVIENMTATQNLSWINQINIFPNPTSDWLFIDIELHESSNLQIQLININRKSILSQQYSSILSEKISFDFGDFPNGIYLLKISKDGEDYLQRIVLGN